MTATAEAGRCELMWVETAGGVWGYDLLEGDEVIGHLGLETESGGRARAEWRGRRWILTRHENLHTHVDVYREEGQGREARFTVRWTGGGIVEFEGGVHFCWNRSHIWSTTYCFRRESKHATVCISQEAPSRKGSKVIVCADALNRPETPVLIVLGWYLEILAYERLAEASISW